MNDQRIGDNMLGSLFLFQFFFYFFIFVHMQLRIACRQWFSFVGIINWIAFETHLNTESESVQTDLQFTYCS